MVAREGEMKSLADVGSNKNHASLGRQSSIYSLTLDEFQHSLCESGKNFGSMNMDEFLSSIWNAEEETSADKGIRKQPSLPRQASLTIPAPLCRKTVDEVWSEIQKEQHHHQSKSNNKNDGVRSNTESAPRQPTFGEMTLEDFLVKAGVVREPCAPLQQNTQSLHYSVYAPSNNSVMPASFGVDVGVMNNVVAPSYQAVAQGGGEPSGYAGNGKMDGGVFPPPPPSVVGGVCYGGGGYGMGHGIGIGGAVSPANSSDGIGNDHCGGQFGVLRGRKRIVDGPVEKVVERRQRRMIKNRESAARSRARKQAYTVELEAELNQLREENAQLKQALAELERRRKQQVFEEVNMRVPTKAQKAKEKLRALRRNLSCSL